ncbi:hypothetical protein ACEN32_06845 [Marinilactibacillus psychrotolerans]|uniref:hypothetical protein n=1 Tax=Marinilactibacillus psychrotolerans TaxID=191770 RepID=UPI00388B6A5A
MMLGEESMEQRMKNRNRLEAQLGKDNYKLDVGALREGAQREEEERADRQRKIREKEEAQRLAEKKEWDDLMAKAGETLKKESEERAAQELKKETEQAQKKLQERISKANNVKSDSQMEKDKAYSNMLSNLNKNK